MWWKYAKPGDKVVFIKGSKQFEHPGYDWLFSHDYGAVFTLSDIRPSLFIKGCPAVIRLAECPINAWIDARGFRPVQTKSTDKGMQILRKILNEQKITEVVL